ncbi:SH3 domain-containing protein [Caldilinea sp.]|uniref:SH3 domain-containing protein n=1 Tax=Caldilinea sp. TaxID=2293560 RepID=UPI002630DBDF|nr:SH3 domain-containing protein [Caldilinea sp.]
MHSAFPRTTSSLFGVLFLIGLLFLSAAPSAMAQSSAEGATPARGQVTVARLNVRSAPSITAPIVARLSQGAVVQIRSVSADGRWYQVTTSDNVGGWLVAMYVSTGAQAGSAAPVAAAPSAAAASSSTAAVAAASPTIAFPEGAVVATTNPPRTNVRGGPGTNYPVVASAPAGSRYQVIGVNAARDWYQVRLPNRQEPAWIFASLTSVSGDLGSIPEVPEAEIPAPPAPASGVSASAAAPAPAPVAAPNTSTGFGYGMSVNMWQGDKQGVANLLKQLGFGWAKQQIRWEFAEPEPGAIQWQEMDAIVDAMHGNGINLMFSVVTAPAWTRPNLGGTGGPPEDFQLFANFLGALSSRYCGRVQAIEVWNEQNLRREWEGFPLEPASYMDLLKRAYNAIKAACPSMLVISGAPTPAGYSDVAYDDIDYLRGMYQHGLKQYSDGVGIHPSGFANPPSVTFEDWQAGRYDAPSHVNHRSFYFLSTLRESRRVMEEFGDVNKRLWPTEFGWGSTPNPFPGYEYQVRIDEATQARWIVESFRIMADSGYVAVPMLWNLNYPRNTEMGAFAVAGRPAFDALRAMMGR